MDTSGLDPEVAKYIARLERLTQQTTLSQFLKDCHIQLSLPLETSFVSSCEYR